MRGASLYYIEMVDSFSVLRRSWSLLRNVGNFFRRFHRTAGPYEIEEYGSTRVDVARRASATRYRSLVYRCLNSLAAI